MEQRAAVVAEARTWRRTPYHSNTGIKGVGVDCLYLLLRVYTSVGLIEEPDPEYYAEQWFLHKSAETYLSGILKHASEIDESSVGPGDVVLFKIERAFSHGAIIIDWPRIIHARGPHRVFEEDISRNIIGKHALMNVPRRFFTLWPK